MQQSTTMNTQKIPIPEFVVSYPNSTHYDIIIFDLGSGSTEYFHG